MVGRDTPPSLQDTADPLPSLEDAADEGEGERGQNGAAGVGWGSTEPVRDRVVNGLEDVLDARKEDEQDVSVRGGEGGRGGGRSVLPPPEVELEQNLQVGAGRAVEGARGVEEGAVQGVVVGGGGDSVLADYAATIEVEEEEEEEEAAEADMVEAGGVGGASAVQQGHTLATLQNILESLEGARDPDDLDVEHARQELAVAHIKAGEYHTALLLLDAVLNVCVRVTGRQHLRVASALNDIAIAHQNLGDLEIALKCFTQSLEIRRIVSAPKVLIAASHANIATIHFKKGEVETALVSLSRAYKTTRLSLSDTDPASIAICKDLGCAYLACGDTERALFHLRQALRVEIRVFGAMSTDVASTLNNVGLALMQRGDHADAIVRLQQAL